MVSKQRQREADQQKLIKAEDAIGFMPEPRPTGLLGA